MGDDELDRKCWICDKVLDGTGDAFDQDGDPVDPTEPASDPKAPDLIFCSKDCRCEFRSENAAAAHFEDAAYGRDY